MRWYRGIIVSAMKWKWHWVITGTLILWVIQAIAFAMYYGCYPSSDVCGPH